MTERPRGSTRDGLSSGTGGTHAVEHLRLVLAELVRCGDALRRRRMRRPHLRAGAQ